VGPPWGHDTELPTLTLRDVDPEGFQKSACAADQGGRCGQPSGHDRGSVQHSSAARPCVA